MKINFFKKILLKLVKPKFFYPRKFLISKASVLDIGLDNNSYNEFKLAFPTCSYVGVDFIDNNQELKSGDKFLKLDLEEQSLLTVFDAESFDVIIMNHVIEHISNGEIVLADLIKLLRKGGVIYLEFPSIRTTYRSLLKQYHFHDDETHKRLYDVLVLANIALDNQCKIISSGPVSTNLKNILSFPRACFSIFCTGSLGADLIFFQGKIDHLFISKDK